MNFMRRVKFFPWGGKPRREEGSLPQICLTALTITGRSPWR